MKYILLLIYAILSAGGLALLRASFVMVSGKQILSLFFIPQFWFGFLLYGGGFLLWLFMLSRNNLSYIFPIAAGSLVIATAVLGYLFLHEQLSLTKVIGIGLIVIGIFCATIPKT